MTDRDPTDPECGPMTQEEFGKMLHWIADTPELCEQLFIQLRHCQVQVLRYGLGLSSCPATMDSVTDVLYTCGFYPGKERKDLSAALHRVLGRDSEYALDVGIRSADWEPFLIETLRSLGVSIPRLAWDGKEAVASEEGRS